VPVVESRADLKSHLWNPAKPPMKQKPRPVRSKRIRPKL